MKNNKLKRLCLAGIFAAVVFLFTAYLHIPSHTGYTHVGDAFIYFAASILPLPYAVFVGVGGAFLADCLTGYALWAPASIVIKGLTVLFFSSKGRKILSLRNILALLPAGILCIGGYYLYEVILTGNRIAPLAGIPGYCTQWVLSCTLYLLLGFAADRWNIKKQL